MLSLAPSLLSPQPLNAPQPPPPAPWCPHAHCASSPYTSWSPALWCPHSHPCGAPSPMMTPNLNVPLPTHGAPSPSLQCPRLSLFLSPAPQCPQSRAAPGWACRIDRQLDTGEIPASPFITKQPSFKKKKQTQTYRQAEAARRGGGRPPMVCLVPDTREVQVAEKVQVHHKAL